MRPVSCATLLALTLTTPSLPGAQERAARPITARPAEFAEPFSAVTRLVELADGRVLLNDSRERKLGVVDFATGAFTEVAREGAGPLEYKTVFSLVRVGGDSVLLWDLGNQRAMLMSPAGKPVRTQRVSEGPNGMMTMFGRPLPRDADAQGRVYSTHRGMRLAGPMRNQSDSVAIVRSEPLGNRFDTLAMYGASQTSMSIPGPEGVVRMRAVGFPALDAWTVFPDGRVLVVRGADYRPEIIGRDRKRTAAPPVPHTRLEVTAADREAHMKQARAQSAGLRMPAPAGGTPPRFETVEPEQWQTHLPPLASTTIRVDSRSRAWVHVRERDMEAGERYDLLDVEGRRVDIVRLPKGSKLVAMGRNVLYTTREDADGLTYLQRFPLP
jgi:hypothetical protein